MANNTASIRRVVSVAASVGYGMESIRKFTSVTPSSTDIIDSAPILRIVSMTPKTTDPVDSANVQKVWVVTPSSTDHIDGASPQRVQLV